MRPSAARQRRRLTAPFTPPLRPTLCRRCGNMASYASLEAASAKLSAVYAMCDADIDATIAAAGSVKVNCRSTQALKRSSVACVGKRAWFCAALNGLTLDARVALSRYPGCVG